MAKDRRRKGGGVSERERIAAELEWAKYGKKWDIIGGIFNGLIRWGGIVACFGFLYLIVDSLAGKTTAADIALKAITDLKLDRGVLYLLTGGTTLWAIRERKLRKKKTRDMEAHVNELEKHIDPNRTSSNLTETGDTHPEDES